MGVQGDGVMPDASLVAQRIKHLPAVQGTCETIKEIKEKFDMKELFASVFKIQAGRLGVEGKKYSSFDFCIADQKDYKEEIK